MVGRSVQGPRVWGKGRVSACVLGTVVRVSVWEPFTERENDLYLE